MSEVDPRRRSRSRRGAARRTGELGLHREARQRTWRRGRDPEIRRPAGGFGGDREPLTGRPPHPIRAPSGA